MCVWESIKPGSTVALERSMTLKPVGGWSGAGETFTMRSFLMKMSWFLSGVAEVPSMRAPARMIVSAESLVFGDWTWVGLALAASRSAAQRSGSANFSRGMASLREAGGSLQQECWDLQG